MTGAVVVDRERLLKLLSLIDSDQDGEALAAARKAASMLREAGMGWDEALGLGGGPARKWSHALDLSGQYLAELRRRVAAERQLEQWRRLAQTYQLEAQRARAGLAPPAAAESAAENAGHPLLDQLLHDERLSAAARARVEAIATWFRRSKMLTHAEEADLESLARSLNKAA
jgi:hypothetical protein